MKNELDYLLDKVQVTYRLTQLSNDKNMEDKHIQIVLPLNEVLDDKILKYRLEKFVFEAIKSFND